MRGVATPSAGKPACARCLSVALTARPDPLFRFAPRHVRSAESSPYLRITGGPFKIELVSAMEWLSACKHTTRHSNPYPEPSNVCQCVLLSEARFPVFGPDVRARRTTGSKRQRKSSTRSLKELAAHPSHRVGCSPDWSTYPRSSSCRTMFCDAVVSERGRRAVADVQHSGLCPSRQTSWPLELNSGTLLATLFPPKAQLQDHAPSPQYPLPELLRAVSGPQPCPACFARRCDAKRRRQLLSPLRTMRVRCIGQFRNLF